MSYCIVYLASPSKAPIHPVNDLRRRYEALKFSITRTRMLFPKTPIYVFHEDYTEEDKKGIEYATPIFLPVDFTGFESVYQRVNAPYGYMMMCRFFSGVLQRHPELQRFSHYIRLDDDSYFVEPYMSSSRAQTYMEYDYLYRSIFYEAKPQQTLYDFTLQFLTRETRMNAVDAIMLQSRLRDEKVLIGTRYTGKAPYNNFHCSSLRLWQHPLVVRYIRAIESVHGCLRHGWLDANIHAMIVWVLAKRVRDLRVGTDTEFGYRHNAHVSLHNSLNVVVPPYLRFIPSDEEDLREPVRVTLELPGTLVFATFANTSYMTTERITNQAKEFGVFDSVRSYTEHDMPEFVAKHADFIREHPRGYGRWIWKPKVPAAAFETMNDNDILVYCDAGMYLNRHGLKRFAEYIDMVKQPSKSIVAFALNGDHTADKYACPDAAAAYFPDFYAKEYRYCYAGVFLMKKTPESVSLVNEWLSLCESYRYLLGMSDREHSAYRGGDADNGLFNLCLAKYDDQVVRVYPDETNIYFAGGSQFYGCPDWSSLRDFPFQCRRIRPAA